MTTPSSEQKLIEAAEKLVKWFDARAERDDFSEFDKAGQIESAEIIRALLSELAELREKAEALEWLMLNERDAIETLMISSLNDWPAILKVMLSERK